MAKADFCFTYYDGDATRDMAHMNRLERGGYQDLIISQRKFGRLTLDQIKKILGKDFDEIFGAISLILKVEDGKYFIEWLDNSINKREAYVISRRRNKTNAVHGESYLYLIKDRVTNLTKIGISLEPEIRLKEIQKYEKEPLLKERDLELIFKSEKVSKKVEGKLHKHYLSKRSYGEWFNLSEEDITNICSTYVEHMEDGDGDEDVKGNEDKGGVGGLKIPSLTDCEVFFQQCDKTREEGEAFFHHYQAQGWKIGNGQEVTDWASLAQKWILNPKKFSNGNSNNREPIKTDWKEVGRQADEFLRKQGLA